MFVLLFQSGCIITKAFYKYVNGVPNTFFSKLFALTKGTPNDDKLNDSILILAKLVREVLRLDERFRRSLFSVC